MKIELRLYWSAIINYIDVLILSCSYYYSFFFSALQLNPGIICTSCINYVFQSDIYCNFSTELCDEYR